MDSDLRNRWLTGILWSIIGVVLVLGGCSLFVPRQEWSQQWGPLVPHHNFPGDCSICHLPERWDKLREDFSFNHAEETGFRLEGAHADAACLRCHNDRGPVQAYVVRGCGGCHVDPHAGSLGMDCQQCHGELSWEPTGAVADHARTRFPLVGVHAVASCESCHEGAAAGQFRGAPIRCESCHQSDLAQATDPDHIANGWVSDCQNCHQPVSWDGAFISHDFFPLAGGHASLDCVQCHTVPGTFTGLSQDCISCHNSDFSTAPGHVANNYSQDCTQCHGISDWDSATFNHSFFPLTGQHAALDCQQCHIGGVYSGLSQDCNACHSADYQSAPDHAAGNYPLTCEQCHSTAGWSPAAFDHSAFLLTGGHAGLDCNACHAGGIYTGLSQDCNACHSADYQGAPNHVAGSYPLNCEQCHVTTAWTPAAFDHSFFALSGGHTGLDCTQCHLGGVYTGLSPDCNSCHSTDYQSAPNHVAGNYPLTCEQCHNINDWSQAVFDHSFFALTGGHSGLDCSQCHAGGVYTGLSTDCISCHSSDYQSADDHAALAFSTDCTECHSISGWTPSNFVHQFPLRGDHDLSCTECHNSGSVQVFSCIDCHEHRKSKADDKHSGVSGYSYNSAACYSCHPTGRE